MKQSDTEEIAPEQRWFFWAITSILAILSLSWSLWLGDFSVVGTSMALALFCSSFLVGSLVGFIFTIFGEEIESLGKIRNSMIAVASGVAGLSIAKATELGGLIGHVRLLHDNLDDASWFSVMIVVLFSIAGFYFMYLLRKIILNPLLAKSQKAIERLQISGNVSAVAADIENAVPQSLLLGREFIGEAIEADGPQAKSLEERLFGKTVSKFLENCETDLAAGIPISKDVIDRAATLYYYQSYFKKDDRDARIETAIAWVSRSLARDPLNISFSVKLADLFGMQERYAETASILERLVGDSDAPQYIRQWLGYYLLYIDGREQKAIDYSLEYFQLFPTEASAPFNISCGYAQLYLLELQRLGVATAPDSENRRKSLEFLEKAIRLDPTSKEWARKYAVVNESFESLMSDEGFLKITKPAATGEHLNLESHIGIADEGF